MSLLRKLLASKELRTPLDFGINENVRLISIDNTERIREGEIVKRNTFMRFAKFNSNNEIIANSEFNYFNLDPASDYTSDNFITQISQLNNIAKVLGADKKVDPTVGYESMNELKGDLETKKGCKKLMDETWKQFHKAVNDKIGNDSTLFRIKVVTDKTGKYMQLPSKDAIIVESLEVDLSESLLKILPFEIKNQSNISIDITTKISPDKVGGAPEAKATKISSVLNL